jgi:hypothetical protein
MVCYYCAQTRDSILQIVLSLKTKGSMKPTLIVNHLRCKPVWTARVRTTQYRPYVAIGKQLRIGRQEDAHEFLRLLVEALQQASLKGREKQLVWLPLLCDVRVCDCVATQECCCCTRGCV